MDQARPMDPAPEDVQLDTSALPDRSQFEAWRRSVVGFEVSRPDHGAQAPFGAKVEGFGFGSFALIASDLDTPSGFKGSPVGQPNNLSFVLIHEGRLAGSADGRRVQAGPGELVLFEWRREADVLLSPSSTLVLITPCSVLGPALPIPAGVHGAALDGSAGRLLGEFMKLLLAQLRLVDQAGRDMLATATREVLVTCLKALRGPPRGGLPHDAGALLARAEAVLAAKGAEPGFGPGALAQALGTTRSTLYRAFAAHGGVARAIRRHRLEEAHRAIADIGDGRSVKTIAFACGFQSVSHFNHSFREAYGYRPLDLRRSSLRRARGIAPDGTPESRLHELVARLGG